MKHKIIVMALTLVLVLLLLPSCTGGVSTDEYNKIRGELTEAQDKLALLQEELTDTEKLQGEYDDLSAAFDVVSDELETIQAEYNQLSEEYDALSAEYDTLTGGAAGISAEDVEQAIIELVNQERAKNGLIELEWNSGLYKWAAAHSRYMATERRYLYSEYTAWQDIFWAAGYNTLDGIANAAMLVWKESRQYQDNVLHENAVYGVVAVEKSGEIFYITYMAHFTG